jgi:hypothetical protein
VGCLDRRREKDTIVGGPTKDQPLPMVMRCRERRQDVPQLEGLAEQPGTLRPHRCGDPSKALEGCYGPVQAFHLDPAVQDGPVLK